MDAVGSTSFWTGNLFNSIARPGVPLFVMISGPLMLDENYVFTKKKWFGHIKKMLSFYIFWSTAYCFVYQIIGPLAKQGKLDLTNIIWAILNGHSHLWFVPMIIGLYLLVPLLRLWVKRINRRYVEYFLILSMVFTVIIPHGMQLLVCINPKFDNFHVLIENIHMKYTLGYTPYFILGWYLHNFELPKKKLLYALGIVGVGIAFFGTYAVFAFTESNEFIFHDIFSVHVLLYTIAIFVLSKSAFGNRQCSSSLLRKIVHWISKYSLGVYAIHVIVIAVVYRFFAQAHAMIAVPSIFVVSTIISMAASFIMNRIPFVRKFI